MNAKVTRCVATLGFGLVFSHSVAFADTSTHSQQAFWNGAAAHRSTVHCISTTERSQPTNSSGSPPEKTYTLKKFTVVEHNVPYIVHVPSYALIPGDSLTVKGVANIKGRTLKKSIIVYVKSNGTLSTKMPTSSNPMARVYEIDGTIYVFPSLPHTVTITQTTNGCRKFSRTFTAKTKAINYGSKLPSPRSPLASVAVHDIISSGPDHLTTNVTWYKPNIPQNIERVNISMTTYTGRSSALPVQSHTSAKKSNVVITNASTIASLVKRMDALSTSFLGGGILPGVNMPANTLGDSISLKFITVDGTPIHVIVDNMGGGTIEAYMNGSNFGLPKDIGVQFDVSQQLWKYLLAM